MPTVRSDSEPVEVISTGSPAALLCDWIDPTTGDFKSIFAAPSPVVAFVQYAATVERSSGGSVRNVGQRFRDITKNDDTAPARLRDELTRILKPLVDQSLISVESIRIASPSDLDEAPDMGAAVVSFKDLVFGVGGTLTI